MYFTWLKIKEQIALGEEKKTKTQSIVGVGNTFFAFSHIIFFIAHKYVQEGTCF